jgi:hypothetical protein
MAKGTNPKIGVTTGFPKRIWNSGKKDCRSGRFDRSQPVIYTQLMK